MSGRSGITVLDAVISDNTAALVLDRALEMTSDVYGNFVERANAIAVAGDVGSILFSSEIGPQLEDLHSGRGLALRIKNLPVDSILPTPPIDGRDPIGKRTFVSEGMGLGIASVIGMPSAILGEKEGALVHQITPVLGREKTQSNEGEVRLRLHQDLAPNFDLRDLPYNVFMPDWLVLTGLQAGTDTTKTYVASVDSALDLLDNKTIDTLYEKRYITNPPDSFKKEASGDEDFMYYPRTHAILEDNNGNTESYFDLSSGLRPQSEDDQDAAQALTALTESLRKVKQEIVIEPGAAVAFNNRRVVHGRSGVAHENDPTMRRWIQRVYGFDFERILKRSIGRPWSVALGAGYVGVINSLESENKLLQLSGIL